MALSVNDPTSFSNPEEVVIKSIHLDLEVKFTEKILTGVVKLTAERVKDDATKLVLDTRQMTILSVNDANTGGNLTYRLGDSVGPFGAKLEIDLPPTPEKIFVISVEYYTDPHIEALQWLSPNQTAGKRKPYLFSQCEAIHCRSIIPIQDTPSVKFTYTAQITAPTGIQILMSALYEGFERSAGNDKTVHTFKQKVCIPSYLIAIAGGDIVSKEIGPRSKVWTEPEYLESCAYEFAETEAMLQTAEKLLGPYVWGHYDLLVLPPSFPYGGMENPCLTFVTPTLLAGDKSLADVVAHEIAHSWTGNLVTNKTFEHFWLNEGNTVFVERKIVSALKDSETYRQYLGFYGWEGLQEMVNLLLTSNPQYTRLVINMEGIDPDDSFSTVPYEKGCAFLFYLEALLGGPDVFNPFMKAYVERFKYKSLTTEDWKNFLYEYFQDKRSILDTVDWTTWFEGEGMPPVKPRFDESMVEVVKTLVDRWVTCMDDQLDQFVYSDMEQFVTKQTEQFLHFILDKEPLSQAKIVKMGEVYKFNSVGNYEIKKRWIEVCIKAQYEEIIPVALQFVTEQGRMKFVLPVYRALNGWEKSRQRAIETFNINRESMHGITATKVENILRG